MAPHLAEPVVGATLKSKHAASVKQNATYGEVSVTMRCSLNGRMMQRDTGEDDFSSTSVAGLAFVQSLNMAMDKLHSEWHAIICRKSAKQQCSPGHPEGPYGDGFVAAGFEFWFRKPVYAAPPLRETIRDIPTAETEPATCQKHSSLAAPLRQPHVWSVQQLC